MGGFLVVARWQAIAFGATRDPDLGSSAHRTDLRARSGRSACAQAARAQGPNSQPKWSPDGKEIAYVTANGQPFFYYANGTSRPFRRRAARRGAHAKFRRGPEPDRLGTGRHLLSARCRRPMRTYIRWIRRRAPIQRISGPDAVPCARRDVHQGPSDARRGGRSAQPLRRGFRFLGLRFRAAST